MLASLFLLAQIALAAPLQWKLVPDGEGLELVARWEDVGGSERSVRAALPARALEEARANPLRFDLAPVYDDVAKQLRTWADHKGYDLKVRRKGEGLQLGVSARDRRTAKRILEEASGYQERALREALPAHRMRLLQSGGVTADHPAIARAAADDVEALARALGNGTDSPREFADRALSFVQTIPYREGGSKGLKLPLRVLELGSGDCDSKGTLFLALMRARHPELPLAMVYVPGHAFVALGVAPREGDHTTKARGRTWVLAEPVGPKLARAGWAAWKSRRALRKHGEIVEVPAR